MQSRRHRAGALGAGLLCCLAAPLAGAAGGDSPDVTPTTDAFGLAAALAPSPGSALTVTGRYVEAGVATSGGAIGTFEHGRDTVGFESGIVLSTGDVTQIGLGGPPAGRDFGWRPSTELESLLSQVPGFGGGFGDAVAFGVDVTPGFDVDFLNFDLAFGTNEIGEQTDRVGLFLNGTYYGLLGGAPLDQFHPWMRGAGTNFGFGSLLYPDGDPLAASFLRVSLPILEPASKLLLEFVLADVFGLDGSADVDSALFVGNLTASRLPEGVLASPVPAPATGALMLAGIGLLAAARRRRG